MAGLLNKLVDIWTSFLALVRLLEKWSLQVCQLLILNGRKNEFLFRQNLKIYLLCRPVPTSETNFRKYMSRQSKGQLITSLSNYVLELSKSQRNMESIGIYLSPLINRYVVVGRLSCKEFEVLDMFESLEPF